MTWRSAVLASRVLFRGPNRTFGRRRAAGGRRKGGGGRRTAQAVGRRRDGRRLGPGTGPGLRGRPGRRGPPDDDRLPPGHRRLGLGRRGRHRHPALGQVALQPHHRHPSGSGPGRQRGPLRPGHGQQAPGGPAGGVEGGVAHGSHGDRRLHAGRGSAADLRQPPPRRTRTWSAPSWGRS